MANPLQSLRLIVALAAILGGSVSAHATSAAVYNPAPTPLYDTTGALARQAKAYFYSAGTTSPLTVYQDAALTTPYTFPINAGVNGVLPPVYLPYSDYRVKITTYAGSTIYDADNIANPDPSAGSSGSGVSGLSTGDIVARLSTGALTGFVRMNGATIGSGASGATERANADTETLFLYLCDNLANSIAAMSGGRGASCEADWAANKAIAVPSMQGRVLAGVDDMGATAGNVVQATTECSAAEASPTVTVTSATGLARTMYAIIDGVATGQISSISGTTLTLSTTYAGTTGSGKTCRLSFFSNAQTAGVTGGGQSATMTAAEMAAHGHSITDPGHTHPYDSAAPNTAAAGGFAMASSSAADTTSNTTGITIDSTGSGLPSSIIQPSRLATWYMKL